MLFIVIFEETLGQNFEKVALNRIIRSNTFMIQYMEQMMNHRFSGGHIINHESILTTIGARASIIKLVIRSAATFGQNQQSRIFNLKWRIPNYRQMFFFKMTRDRIILLHPDPPDVRSGLYKLFFPCRLIRWNFISNKNVYIYTISRGYDLHRLKQQTFFDIAFEQT